LILSLSLTQARYYKLQNKEEICGSPEVAVRIVDTIENIT
jgi:hypothetical protein